MTALTPANPSPRRWSPRSLALIVAAWLILQIGGLWSPGLLDDVDSVYLEVAREMLHRHDFVTPYVNGIRFFDKPPLMYWMASGSMSLFGESDWAGRLPLALAVLALFFAVYALGLRLFATDSPASHPDRGGLYTALAVATGIGPYLYTRFFIPDILIALWMTLGVHLFLIALDRAAARTAPQAAPLDDRITSSHPEQEKFVILSEAQSAASKDPRISSWIGSSSALGNRQDPRISSWIGSFSALGNRQDPRIFSADRTGSNSGNRQDPEGINATPTARTFPTQNPSYSTAPNSTLLPSLLFSTTLALNLLTKGLIGLVFPIAFVLLYLLITRQFGLVRKLHPIASLATFAAVALPWHILAALRTPAIAMPPGLGLPHRAGWAWFYLYNEHFARFLNKRIPQDYGVTPVWLFWLYAAIWVMPWSAFLPTAITVIRRHLGHLFPSTARQREAALALTLWALVVLVFFSISTRQEYYSIPALPALCLMSGWVLARADTSGTARGSAADFAPAARGVLFWHRYLLLPISCFVAGLCAWFALTAHHPAPGVDLSSLLASNPDLYTQSLGHLFDLTGDAMGLFPGPLAATALGFLLLGPLSFLFRRGTDTYAANLTLAAGMIVVLLAAHEGLVRFNPILGSKDLALRIAQLQTTSPSQLTILDGEFTSGSSVPFYTRQPVHLINGRVNGLWYGSFWPDAPQIFEDETSLRHLWTGSRRIILFTYHPTERTSDLTPLGPVIPIASAGGKTLLTNQPLPQ